MTNSWLSSYFPSSMDYNRNATFLVTSTEVFFAATNHLKDLCHPACITRVISWFAFIVTIFMAHKNGDKQWPAKRRHVPGILDEIDLLNIYRVPPKNCRRLIKW